MMGRKSLSKESRVNILIVKLKVEKGDLSWKLLGWEGFKGKAFFEWETEMVEKSLLMPLIGNLLECRSVKCLWQASQRAEWGMWWPITRNVRFPSLQGIAKLMGAQKQRACVGSHVSAELHVTSNRDMCLRTKAELSIFDSVLEGFRSLVRKVFVQTFGFNRRHQFQHSSRSFSC